MVKEYSKFYFYSDDGLYKLLSDCIFQGNQDLGCEIIVELKKRSNSNVYTMSKDMQIETIIRNLDFERIHKVMEHIDWVWYSGGMVSVPTVGELKKNVINGLNNIWDGCEGGPHTYTSSGGFRVECWIYEGKRYLQASFNLTEFDVDYETLHCRDMDEIVE